MIPINRPRRVAPRGDPSAATDRGQDKTSALPRRVIAWLRCFALRLDGARALGLAAEMAFWFFLSLVPLAAVAGVLTAKVASGRRSTMAPLLESLPAATRELVATELAKVAAWNGGRVGVVAVLMFLWLASSGVHSIIDGIELASDATPRAWWQKRLLALGTCLGLSIGLALLALLGAGVGSAWTFVTSSTTLGAVDFEATLVGRAARLGVGAGVWVALVSGLYLVALPASSRKLMPIVPGAVLATVLQIALGLAYGFYLSKAGDGGAYQAGLASIGVTLTALYLACLVLLVGIEFNRVAGEGSATACRPRVARQPPEAPLAVIEEAPRSRVRLARHRKRRTDRGFSPGRGKTSIAWIARSHDRRLIQSR